MKNKEKLINKLKEVEEVKNDIEELRFGTYIKNYRFYRTGKITKITHLNKSENYYYADDDYHEDGKIYDDLDRLTFDIIGNPLEERHLRMYFMINKHKYIYTGYIDNMGKIWYGYEFISQIDNTKPFSEQSEEVYGEILDYINNL